MEHKIERMIVLEPDYMKNFHCIGSACEDSCCVGAWDIFVDKDTWFKYRNLPPSPLKRRLDKHVGRNRKNPSSERYAKINFGEQQQCPLLREDNLCGIQIELGETYLCKVCRTYPRYTNLVDGHIERMASLSCNEAARCALLSDQVIEFEETTQAALTPIIVNCRLTKEDLQHGLLQHFYILRAFAIECLQARDHELWQRLIILGLFCQAVQEQQDQGVWTEIPATVEKYRTMLAAGLFKEAFSEIPAANMVQRKILKQLVDERLMSKVSSAQYMACLKEVFLGLNFLENASEEQLEKAYQTAAEEYLLPFMMRYGYILENYLVNYVFKNLFPVGAEKRIMDAYVILILNYALLKMHLLGLARYHKEHLTVEHLIRLIASFVKTVDHNPDYIKRTFQLIQDNKMNNLPYMAILVKN